MNPVRRSPSWLALALSAMFTAAPVISSPALAAAPALTVLDPAPLAHQVPGLTLGDLAEWSRRVWTAAAQGDEAALRAELDKLPAGEDAASKQLAASIESLRANFAKREAERAKRIEEVRQELDKALAAEPQTDITLSGALRSAIEMHMLSTDKKAMLEEPRITGLVERARAAAAAAESRGDWLIASELYSRLDNLLDEKGIFKKDLERQVQRLSMLRLYVPQRLWELRNERQNAEIERERAAVKAEDLWSFEAKIKPLPEYNPAGDDFRQKLAAIERYLVVKAVARAGTLHVERTPMKSLAVGGLNAVKTMASTPDLRQAFPGFADDGARARLIEFIDREIAALTATGSPTDVVQLDSLVGRLLETNRTTVQAMDQAVLHEFGNGAMDQLDEFSAIVWPDELSRFQRNTQGKLTGVGIHIEFDELSNIRVVSPLEGTPAYKAGIRPGDLITKVNGKPTFGLGLDQAVDLITGPVGTKVQLTVDREDEQAEKKEDGTRPRNSIDFDLTRTLIDIKTVKGWKRNGSHEDDWDWFIDPQARIGYLRLTQFTDSTTPEFDRAIRQMRDAGLRGLIFDLRFNPGGLLPEAVSIANRFVGKGVIVKTRGPTGRIEQQELADAGAVTLGDIPTVVLINEGSASASEIVSGAISAYAKEDGVPAIVLGERSYGKGSVQNVWPLMDGRASMKLTTQYYYLRDERIIHRKPGASVWGIDPNTKVMMLPKQIVDALTLRKNADVIPLDAAKGASPDPDALIKDGLDLQLQAALVILQTQSLGGVRDQAQVTEPKGRPGSGGL
ncbi:MAG: PDZ domain-containing protein [Phycisphaerales bacterium]|nr:PDZ domain-containing protein [Phycisphaerales bacterium]